jgi:hypothetical protein
LTERIEMMSEVVELSAQAMVVCEPSDR